MGNNTSKVDTDTSASQREEDVLGIDSGWTAPLASGGYVRALTLSVPSASAANGQTAVPEIGSLASWPADLSIVRSLILRMSFYILIQYSFIENP